MNVSLNGQHFTRKGAVFTVYKPVEVKELRPSCGLAVGRTLLEIVGSGFFKSDMINVRFGAGKEAISVPGHFNSESVISCRVPECYELLVNERAHHEDMQVRLFCTQQYM